MDLGRRIGGGEGVRRPFDAAGGTWVDTAIAGGRTRAPRASTASSAAIRPPRCSSTPASSSTSWSPTACCSDLDEVAAAGKWREVLPPAIVDGRHPRRQVLRRAGQHPRHRLALVQQAGPGRGRHRRAQDLARGAGGGREAQGGGLIPLAQGGQPWQERTLFNSVLLGRRRHRPISSRSTATSDRTPSRAPKFKEVAETVQQLRRLRRCRAAPAATGTTPRHGDHRQGRRCRSWATGPRASSSPPA